MIKLPYGLKNGVLVHIDEVERGLECNCVCPACNHKLIAKKGEKSIHHFAHYKESECKHYAETALHLAAKEILEKEKKIRLPKVLIEFDNCHNSWELSDEIVIEFDDIKLENKLNDIVPDIIVYKNNIPLIIEIKVTHAIDDIKLEKLKKLNISTIEIDLSKYNREFNYENLKNVLVDKVEFKKWISNCKANKVKDEIKNSGISKRKMLTGAKTIDEYNLCPIGTLLIKGRRCARFTQCIHCYYCIGLDVYSSTYEHYPTHVHCTYKSKIKSFKDYTYFKQQIKNTHK